MDLLSGEPPQKVFKAGPSETAIDATELGLRFAGPETKAYTPLIKLGVGFLADAVAEAAISQPEPTNGRNQLSENDVKTVNVYETSDRYLRMFQIKSSNCPVIGLVFERHGLRTWKWVEIRLLPSEACD